MQPQGWYRGGEWPSLAVWLPGLLTLAPLCDLLYHGGWVDGLLAVAVIALLAAGLRKPGWRPPIAVTLWAAFAFSYWIWAIAHVLKSFT